MLLAVHHSAVFAESSAEKKCSHPVQMMMLAEAALGKTAAAIA
jgi:hypothetical protein